MSFMPMEQNNFVFSKDSRANRYNNFMQFDLNYLTAIGMRALEVNSNLSLTFYYFTMLYLTDLT